MYRNVCNSVFVCCTCIPRLPPKMAEKFVRAVTLKAHPVYRYQKVVTQPIPKWQKLLKDKLVITPEHFVKILNSTELRKPGLVDRNLYFDIKSEAYDYFIASDKKIRNTDEKAVKDLDKTKPETNTTAITLNSDTENDDIDEILLEKINIMKEFPEELTKSLNNESETDHNLQENLKICRELPEAILIDKFANNETNFKRKNLIQKYISAKEPMSDSEESTTDVEYNPKIDLKLLMNTIVYTTKLDAMNVFKFTDFTSVNNIKLIECAINESKPFDKPALKDEDIKKFREEAIHGYETNGFPSDNDMQTDEENAIDRVKCTSWLLQKPKNRHYNPIQLCINPDFNTRLKRLTAGFMSSTRNREFLKECKPLTIDLHKAFEKKLVNGTLYLKSGDLRIAKFTEADKMNDKPVSVLPSAIPGQSMIFTSTSNDIETAAPNKLGIQKDNMPLSSFVQDTTCSERRKTINLPDIDQVRRFNQSLLTAEVIPTLVENKINNSNSCEESIKAVVQQPAFVKPISLEPLLKIKNEPNEENTTLLRCLIENPNFKISYGKDQIENGDDQEIQSCPHKKERILIEKVTQRKDSQREQQKNYHETNTIQLDLTKSDKESDSPSIINLNKPSTDNTKANSPILQEALSTRTRTKNEIEQLRNHQETNAIQVNLSKYNQVVDFASTSNQQGVPKRNYKKLIDSTGNYIGIYCCWAREKIVSMTDNKEPNPSTHGCTIYRCQCCCRHELVNLMTWKTTDSFPCIQLYKNNHSTTVLSDDENVTKITETSKENFRIAGKRTPCYLVPSLAPLTKTVSHPNFANIEVKNVTVQSEIPQSNFSIVPSNVVQPTSRENDMIVMPKLFKTTVHAAEGHVYNKRVESIDNNSTEHFPYVPNTDINLDKEILKSHECTLYLNSNQLMNKPTKTPIFLGKNEVLLCSLTNEKLTAPPINKSLLVLPYGVNFVVSNGELTLSFDNGVQLDSEQLSTLSALMCARVSTSEMVNPTINSSESQNISIAGPYSNLFSFEPTTPLNYLLKCVAQLIPELNAVTSFAELKYVYVNGGQFYKLDVDLGTITEIKVLIKNNSQKQVDMTPKAVDTPVSQIDFSYDSSEEEPLPKKSKSKQETKKHKENTIPSLEDTENTPSIPEEVVDDTNNIPDMSGDFANISDVEINSMDIEGVNPELHPIAFEEGSESDEDNCILGV